MRFWKKKPKVEDSVFSFEPDEELPLEVWSYFVKRRANFRCEECGKKGTIAHHITPRPEGKNTLRNGICLCSKCHGKKHIIEIPEQYKKTKLFGFLGKRKYNKLIMSEVRKINGYTCNTCFYATPNPKSDSYFSCDHNLESTKDRCELYLSRL